MKISHRGIVALEAREGIRLTVYRDSVGIPTVGVGHVCLPEDNLKVGDKITQARCDEFLAKDIARFEKAVDSAVKVPLLQNQIDSCISFAFNIGEAGFNKSAVVKCINARNFDCAAKAFMNWVTPKEITGRRRTEVKQFLTPYPNSATADISQSDLQQGVSSTTAESTNPVAERPLLAWGSVGKVVRELQAKLGVPVDGVFKTKTEDAVEIFQLNHDLVVDGKVGKETWARLEASSSVVENPVVKQSLTTGPGAEGNAPIAPSPHGQTDVVIEKEPDAPETKPTGFFGPLWQKVTAAIAAVGGTDAAIEKAQQAKTFGLSDRTWELIFYALIAGIVIWIVYHFVVVKILPWSKWLLGRIRTNQLIASNANADSTQVIESGKLAEYEAKGYTVVRRS